MRGWKKGVRKEERKRICEHRAGREGREEGRKGGEETGLSNHPRSLWALKLVLESRYLIEDLFLTCQLPEKSLGTKACACTSLIVKTLVSASNFSVK